MQILQTLQTANGQEKKQKRHLTVHWLSERVKKEVLVLVMEAIQPSAASAALNLASNSALNVADLRRQECRGDGEQGEYYLGE